MKEEKKVSVADLAKLYKDEEFKKALVRVAGRFFYFMS